MARNNETFGRATTPSAGGPGAATTVFGGTIDTVAQQRLAQQRLGAQLRDPGEPGLLGQEPHDPNRIIITEDMIAKPAEPATPEMARASALRHAAFRTGAELSLLSGLETVKARTFGNPDLDDREAASLFRQNAALLTREAIERMSHTFGSPEDVLEMPTRAVLEDMVDGVASEGAKARARGLEEMALDILEAGADDLLAQIRSAPDLAPGYGAQMEAMTARYEGGIDADALAAFRANMAAEMAQARVLGLAETGRFDEARTALGEVPLPDGQAGLLEREIESAARHSRISNSQRSVRNSLRLQRRVADGESPFGEIDAAVAAGETSGPTARRLNQLRVEHEARERQSDELTAIAESVAQGSEWPAGLSEIERKKAVDLFWERIAPDVLDDFSETERPMAELDLIESLGRLPRGKHHELALGLRAGNIDERGGTATEIVRLNERDFQLVEHFSIGELRFAEGLSNIFGVGLDIQRIRSAATEFATQQDELLDENSTLHFQIAVVPAIPAYKEEWFENQPAPRVNEEAWVELWEAVVAVPFMSETEAKVIMDIFAAEGGIASTEGGTVAGITQRTLDGHIASGLLRGIPAGTLSADLTMEQRVMFYRAELDFAFRNITGHSRTVYQVLSDSWMSAAVADALLRVGPSSGGGGLLIQRAINDVIPDRVPVDGSFGPLTLGALVEIRRDEGLRRQFLDALAEHRNKRYANEGDRNSYFRGPIFPPLPTQKPDI